jgi:hypothetical protein
MDLFSSPFLSLIRAMTDPGCLPCPRLSATAALHDIIRSPRSSFDSGKTFEDWLYSIIIAAFLVALLLGILGQLNSPQLGAQSAISQSPTIIERTLPTQAKDGRF